MGTLVGDWHQDAEDSIEHYNVCRDLRWVAYVYGLVPLGYGNWSVAVTQEVFGRNTKPVPLSPKQRKTTPS